MLHPIHFIMWQSKWPYILDSQQFRPSKHAFDFDGKRRASEFHFTLDITVYFKKKKTNLSMAVLSVVYLSHRHIRRKKLRETARNKRWSINRYLWLKSILRDIPNWCPVSSHLCIGFIHRWLRSTSLTSHIASACHIAAAVILFHTHMFLFYIIFPLIQYQSNK